MINHARTLLMNVSGPSRLYSHYYGEEFIPDDYSPVTFPGSLQAVRRIMFGSNPDRAMLNYRSRQFMALLHATELKQFVTDLDPRITYELDNADLFPKAMFLPSVQPLGSTTGTLTVVGDPPVPDAGGQLYHEWIVAVTSSDLVNIKRLYPYTSVDAAYTVSSGLSSLIPLPGSSLNIRIPQNIGESWRVTSYSRPTPDLGSIAYSLQFVGTQALSELFKTATPQGQSEPYRTFSRLWQQRQELGYKLGGALLALIYSTEDLR